MATTIKDIAKKTNYSISTISRVLNYDKTLSVPEETRKKIFEAAEKLNYKPSKRGRRSNQNSRYKIGLLYWYNEIDELDDPYYLSIRFGVERRTYTKAVEMVMIYKNENSLKIDGLNNLNGIVAVGKFSDKEILLLNKLTDNIVFVDYSPNEAKYDSVVIDFEFAINKCLDFIINKGHSHIGYIGGKEYVGDNIPILGERRKISFVNYLNEKGLLDETVIFEGNFRAETGYEIMKKLIEKGNLPSVFLTGNDSIAIGALRALHEAKIKVPSEVSIMGFNDIPTSSYTAPPLTTLRVHTEFMGETAVDLLLEKIDGRSLSKKVIIPTCIVERESVANR